MFAKPNTNRTQMIWASDINYRSGNEKLREIYQDDLRRLREFLHDGHAAGLGTTFSFNQIWVSESLIDKH